MLWNNRNICNPFEHKHVHADSLRLIICPEEDSCPWCLCHSDETCTLHYNLLHQHVLVQQHPFYVHRIRKRKIWSSVSSFSWQKDLLKPVWKYLQRLWKSNTRLVVLEQIIFVTWSHCQKRGNLRSVSMQNLFYSQKKNWNDSHKMLTLKSQPMQKRKKDSTVMLAAMWGCT